MGVKASATRGELGCNITAVPDRSPLFRPALKFPERQFAKVRYFFRPGVGL